MTDVFTLCKTYECDEETTFSPYSEKLRESDKYVLVLSRETQRSHDGCHSVTLLCDDSEAIRYHAACMHNAGRLYALYKKNDTGTWDKLITNV